MYNYFKGTLVAIEGDKAIIEVANIGYEFFVGFNFVVKAPQIGSSITLFTQLITREDSTSLFGFITKIEKDLFIDVQSVSGIGPKLALAISSSMSPSTFAQAITNNDIKMISSIPGIGKKSAERIIMELKEKVSKYISLTNSPDSHQGQFVEEAVAALVALGLPKPQATQAVNRSIQARPDVSDVSRLLQLALSQKNA